MGADYALKEFLGPRSDNQDAKIQMYQDISDQGYVSMNSLESDIESSQTINTIDMYFLAAGIKTDLITSSLALPRTIKLKKRRETISSKLEKK